MNNLLKNKRFKIIFIASLIMLVFFLFDWLTKYYLFDEKNLYVEGKITSYQDYKAFGVRSLKHSNTTFFSFLKINIGWQWLVVIDFALLVIFIIPLFLVKNKIFAFSLGILLGGMFGNSLDLLTPNGHYVRDIFYLPWFDRGTFNLADVFIVVGSLLTFIGILATQFNFKKGSKNNI